MCVSATPKHDLSWRPQAIVSHQHQPRISDSIRLMINVRSYVVSNQTRDVLETSLGGHRIDNQSINLFTKRMGGMCFRLTTVGDVWLNKRTNEHSCSNSERLPPDTLWVDRIRCRCCCGIPALVMLMLDANVKRPRQGERYRRRGEFRRQLRADGCWHPVSSPSSPSSLVSSSLVLMRRKKNFCGKKTTIKMFFLHSARCTRN